MNKEQRKIYDRQRYLKIREETLEREKQRRILNPERGHQRFKKWRKKNPEKVAIISARCQSKLKTEVLTHYANGELKCVICGEKRFACLTLDHINNNGNEHRKEIGNVNMYRFLRAQKYPDGFQVLCMNCQWVKKSEYQIKRRVISKSLSVQ